MKSNQPLVSFVVPCYKLAHVLRQCIDSILSQTYTHLEVIVMDDCSPDNTGEVAAGYSDKRVLYERNEPNLGHLRNYNKGIGLCRGQYIWLISADDYLRDSQVLERYLGLLESDPRVGYTFCAGCGVVNGKETGVLEYSRIYKSDCVLGGHTFLKKLLRGNIVLAASGLVRRECYERLGAFPVSIEMGWTGDWYLWCLFALHYDVGYFADAMVCYREHGLSMTTTLKEQNSPALPFGDIAVPWMIKKRADQEGFIDVSRDCLKAIAYTYIRVMTRAEYSISMSQFEESLSQYAVTDAEKIWLRARVYAGVGDGRYWQGHCEEAKRLYRASLSADPSRANVLAKVFLLWLGQGGRFIRRAWRVLAENHS